MRAASARESLCFVGCKGQSRTSISERGCRTMHRKFLEVKVDLMAGSDDSDLLSDDLRSSQLWLTLGSDRFGSWICFCQIPFQLNVFLQIPEPGLALCIDGMTRLLDADKEPL